jgi:hypothetical protein
MHPANGTHIICCCISVLLNVACYLAKLNKYKYFMEQTSRLRPCTLIRIPSFLIFQKRIQIYASTLAFSDHFLLPTLALSLKEGYIFIIFHLYQFILSLFISKGHRKFLRNNRQIHKCLILDAPFLVYTTLPTINAWTNLYLCPIQNFR